MSVGDRSRRLWAGYLVVLLAACSDSPATGPDRGRPADGAPDQISADLRSFDAGRQSELGVDRGGDPDSKPATPDGPSGPCPGEDTALDVDANSVPDCEENLLSNGQFATGVAGWDWPPDNAEVVFLPASDAQGQSASGAARVTNKNVSTASTVVGAEQCIPVAPSTTYTIFAKHNIPAGQAQTPSAGFLVFSFAGTACLGAIAAADNSPGWDTPVGTWTLRSFTFTTPPTAKMAKIRLGVTKPAGAGDLSIWYDSVLLRPGS